MNLQELISQLKTPVNNEELSSIDFECKYKSGKVVIALDYYGAFHCLFEFSSVVQVERISNGFSIKSRKLISKDKQIENNYLDLCWNNPYEYKLFIAVISEIAYLELDETQLIDEIKSKVKKWDYLLSKSSEEISLSEAVGIYGELLILEWLLSSKKMKTLAGWTGPLGMPHDFELDSSSLEIKTSISGEQRIEISSLDQLERSANKKLFLIKIDICEDSTGISSLEIIESLIKRFNFRSDFDQYISLVAKNYEQQQKLHIRFKTIRIYVYAVDEQFPKITRTNLSNFDNFGAIIRINYGLEMSQIIPASEVDSVDELTI